jgi:hypothetical protein
VNELIEDAIKAWSWISDTKNSEPQPALTDSPESRGLSDAFGIGDAMMPVDARRFAVNRLFKAKFGRLSKDKLNAILARLELVGVVGSSFDSEPTGGRTKEMRRISAEWQCTDNPEVAGNLETKLRELLTKAINATEIAAKAAREEAVQLSTEEVIREAATAYDWLADGDNLELNHHNEAVFSTGMLQKTGASDETVNALRKVGVIGQLYKEPNARGRMLCTRNAAWFPCGKERMIKALTPAKPEDWVQVGPLRMLHTSCIPIAGQMMQFSAGQIIYDEHVCKILAKGGALVVPASDMDTCICPVSHCRHRFKLSETVPPVMRPLVWLDALNVEDGHQFFFRGQLMRRQPGDIEWREDLIKFLTQPGVHFPVAEAGPIEFANCPACGTISKRSALLGECLKKLEVAS